MWYNMQMHNELRIGVDIFSTDEECWATSLVARTGGATTCRDIAMAAIKKGWQFKSTGSGFDTPSGKIICHTEQEVFEAVGLPYLPPEKRK
jgi:DNA polymerase/3'-5' exonuclease PolX